MGTCSLSSSSLSSVRLPRFRPLKDPPAGAPDLRPAMLLPHALGEPVVLACRTRSLFVAAWRDPFLVRRALLRADAVSPLPRLLASASARFPPAVPPAPARYARGVVTRLDVPRSRSDPRLLPRSRLPERVRVDWERPLPRPGLALDRRARELLAVLPTALRREEAPKAALARRTGRMPVPWVLAGPPDPGSMTNAHMVGVPHAENACRARQVADRTVQPRCTPIF